MPLYLLLVCLVGKQSMHATIYIFCLCVWSGSSECMPLYLLLMCLLEAVKACHYMSSASSHNLVSIFHAS